ncbi:unnamed protein product [Toxocara canis]|nr:unnamed protein product [Toxocara canis]
MGIVWFFGALIYLIGKRISGRGRRFLEDRWRGYDDGDPNVEAALKAEGIVCFDRNVDLPTLIIHPRVDRKQHHNAPSMNSPVNAAAAWGITQNVQPSSSAASSSSAISSADVEVKPV